MIGPISRTDIAHGYSAGDLHRAAVIAAAQSRYPSTPFDERYRDAWSETALLLSTAAERPAWRDLIYTGRTGAERATRRWWAERGIYLDNDTANGSQYARYWGARQRMVSPWEDAVIDRLTLAQILPLLPGLHAEALWALAVHGTYTAAADHLGITYANLMNRVTRGRREFRRLWHDGETPSGMWGRDERARRGTNTVSQSRDSTRRRARKAGAA